MGITLDALQCHFPFPRADSRVYFLEEDCFHDPGGIYRGA
ncbi:hypothetical protein FF011L_53960 [Roseimaritima multifibrata]|uniref:Uncharacterized protein n=1 Tax=Roseimaritima multifibrata TaxID=1930274 RepID=A0A517MNY7_9BACT|nr:hypothetical protein FF011L_53960 [Roseimaritima multifibrata]